MITFNSKKLQKSLYDITKRSLGMDRSEPRPEKRKIVYELDENGNLLNKYESFESAVKITGIGVGKMQYNMRTGKMIHGKYYTYNKYSYGKEF